MDSRLSAALYIGIDGYPALCVNRHLSSVEFYRVDVDEWDSAPDISEARIGIAMATYHGQLFIVGGFSETENEHVVRGTVEVYDHTVRRYTAWTEFGEVIPP